MIAARDDGVVTVRRIESERTHALDGDGAAIVDQQRELHVAVILVNQPAKIAETDLQIRLAVIELLVRDPRNEVLRGGRHHLREAERTDRARGAIVELTLDANEAKAQVG